jgi:uncharacterized protein YcfJ
MKRLSSLLPAILALFCGTFAVFGQGKNLPAVYVWDFTDRTLQKTEQTANFTHDFEVALMQFGGSNYRVIERRQLDRLQGHAENEAKIASMAQLSPEAVATLKTQKAEQVIFGEVYDDVSSGQVSITVTFEDFSGQKKLIKSTLMARGMVNDASSRASAMEKLVKEIAARQVSVNKKESDGFLFEIVKCSQSDKVVTVDFIVTNNQDDRKIRMDASSGGTSRLFDDAGNEIAADRVKLANKSDGSYVNHLMVSGLPTKCQFIFDGDSGKANTIARLEINYVDQEIGKDFRLIFRNIALEK